MDTQTKKLLPWLGLGALGFLIFKSSGAGTPAMTLTIIPGQNEQNQVSRLVGRGIAGYSVGVMNPTGLVAGSTGNQAIVNVINTSVYQGTTIQAPYTFQVALTIYMLTPIYEILPLTAKAQLPLGAGATGTYTWTFSVPIAAPGGSYRAEALLYNAAGAQITTANATGIITAATIIPGGTITF